MDKKIVEAEIETAYQAIKLEIAGGDGYVNSAFRGQISAFGASVVTSGAAPAVAFYCKQGAATIDRSLILHALDKILKTEITIWDEKESNVLVKRFGYGEPHYEKNATPELRLFKFASKRGAKAKEEIVNASIALKLAIQMFPYANE